MVQIRCKSSLVYIWYPPAYLIDWLEKLLLKEKLSFAYDLKSRASFKIEDR